MEVSEIIDQVDILEYISQFCDLEEKSDGEFWGLSPLQEENTPSFSVNDEIQKFYDFSSGHGGNVLDFVCLYNQCDFRQGLEILKKYANISENDATVAPRRLLATTIAKRFGVVKRKSKSENIHKSQILLKNYMDRYEKNEGKLSAWRDEGISLESMERFQVRYDPFSNRIVYPIRNMSGDIINVCGRTLDPLFKEKGLRKYTYFKSFGLLDTIYGLAENMEFIRKEEEVILFEGAKSVMLADGWGIKNTGALLTSHLSDRQMKILIRLGVRVVFALDAEINIRKDINIRKLLPYVPVEWVSNRNNLLDNKDAPVDKGEDVFRKLYRERRRLR